jgi:hypothetical protein
MPRIATPLVFFFSAWLVSGVPLTLADDDRPAPKTPELAASQVTLGIAKGGRNRLFQATALRIEDDVLTVLTAASLVDGEIQGKPAHLLVDGDLIDGTVVAVNRNPSHVPGRPKVLPRVDTDHLPLPRVTGPNTYYKNTRLRSIAQPMHTLNHQQIGATTASEIPGANNAIVQFRFPSQLDSPVNDPIARPFRKIRPINALTSGLYPGASGGIASAWIVGGDGQLHGVMACNFHNPLVLEWGHGFDPVRDDSGAGVFALREVSGGQFEPVLIGVLIGPDSRGGQASLIAGNMPWLETSLASKPGLPETPGDKRLNSAPPGR